MVEFNCTKCGHHYAISDKYEGKSVRCKPCGSISQIPESEPHKMSCGDTVKAYNQLLEELSHYEKNAPTLGLDG